MPSERILVVDDDRMSCEMLEEALGHRGFTVAWTTDPTQVLRMIDVEGPFDTVITDLRMGEHDGIELCKSILAREPSLPVIVITAFGNIRTAVEAMRSGAYDFITKPFDLEMTTLVVKRAVAHSALHRQLQTLRHREPSDGGLSGMLGQSPAMQRVYETIRRVASLDSTVLITGESGTGKELAARALHLQSPRAQAPFVPINCAAIPEALLESELFGHAKGAFTDARAERAGLFVKAGGGTLFLDEIGEMPPSMQVKLLRALQERRVRPVGSDREVPFAARLVAATHRDLEDEVAAGRFRQDLFFRIHVIELLLPPLRARGADVVLLATSFVQQHAARMSRPLRLSSAAAERLLSYDWPGNVRELENCMERAAAMAAGEEILVEHLPDRVRGGAQQTMLLSTAAEDLISLEEMERRYILHVLRSVHGNKKLAAQVLRLDRSTLYRKLDRYAEAGPGSS